jgi:PAS domain S-box-containing protein
MSTSHSRGSDVGHAADEMRELRLRLQLQRDLRDVGSFDRLIHVFLRSVAPHFGATDGVVLAGGRGANLRIVHRLGKRTWDLDVGREILESKRVNLPDGTLYLPLSERGKRIAVMLLSRDTPFESHTLPSLRRLGAIFNERLDALAESRVVEVLARIERKIASELQTSDLLYQILAGLQLLVRYDHSGSILLLDRERSRLVVRAEKISWRKMKSPHVNQTMGLDAELVDLLRVYNRSFLLESHGDRTKSSVHPLTDCCLEPKSLRAKPAALEKLYGLLCYSCSSGIGPPEIHMMVVPILFGRRLLGILKLSSQSRDAFTPADVTVVGRFVEKMSTAIRNAELYERRITELRAINEIGQLVTQALPMEQTCRRILEIVLWVMNVPVGSIELFDLDEGRLRKLASIGYSIKHEGLGLGEGITGEVARTGEPIVANDVHAHPKYVVHSEKARSELAVPMRFEGTTLGVLNVESFMPNRFRDRDVEFLTILADKTATALATLEQRERQESTMRLLYDLSARLAAPEDLGRLLQLTVDVTRKHLNCEVASLFLFEEDCYRRRANSGVPQEWFPEESFCTGEGLTGRAAVLRPGPYPPPVVHNDVEGSGEALPVVLQRYREILPSGRIVHLIAVPLLEDRRPIGILRVINRLTRDRRAAPGGFSHANVALLSTIASQVSLAVADQLKQQRIQEMSAQLEGQVRDRTAEVQRLATFVENAPLAIFWIDADGLLQFVNEAGERMFGFQAAELRGKRADTKGSGILGDQFDALEQVVSFMRRWAGELECHRADRSTFPVYLSARKLEDAEGAHIGMVVFARDISATKALEQQLLESEGKRAMADLAGGVAHDVNNALGASLPMIQALKGDLEEGHFEREQFLEDLQQIENYTRISTRIFQGMLSMARGTFAIDQMVDVNERIATALDLVSFKLDKARVQVRLELAHDLPRLLAHPGRLEQAFHNLILNAIDAMPDGGTLTLKSRIENDTIIASVTDTGVGIPEELLARVQEPFYTSKGHGTGLGLSVVRSIVWEHNGKMTLESRVAEGTTVRLEFPMLGHGPTVPAEN